ncbi:putative zinc-ribbon domain-containing protein [Carex littledalei]|uniref:Putative zinc-ribbon domain-containing protein n=1 Tax=Carex littledalei TaxID=544730 RepID=A0A833RCT6_9POAL|nr:putative zinc-ribbon domain-containing protein [Carex littledalei]
MEEEVGAQIRVVRCPKCEKLLPELPNYSVYLCGACGATLQAKKLNQEPDFSPEKSNGANVKYLELVESDSDKKRSSPLRASALAETDKPIRRLEPAMHKQIQRHASPTTASEVAMNPSSSKTSLPFRENGSDLNQTKYRRVPKLVNTGSTQSNSKQEVPNMGLSEQNPNARIEGLEQDRAALLQMLEEIRDQVKRSCEIAGKQNPATPSPATRVVEPSRPRSGYNAGVPSYYPHGYGWRNQNPEYFYPQFEPDPLVSYHHEGFYHQPACACLHCYRELPVPVQGPPPNLYNNHRAVPALPYHVYHQHGFGNARSSDNSPNFRESRMRKIKHKRCRPCQPIAGASPFVICYNCYELLQVPKMSPIADKKKAQVKLRCGSCSHAMILTVDGNEIIVSSGHENENSNDDVSDFAHGVKGLFPVLKYSFSSKNDDNATGSDRMQRGHSLSSSQETESETEAVSRVPSLPLHEHLNNSFTEKGNMSARSEQEKAVLFAENFKQNSVKDVAVVSVPTEMDFSPDEYPQQGLSQDSDAGHEEERPVGAVGIHGVKGSGGDSFFANIFKKSLKGGNGRSKVSVNGYALSDRVVKKAEKRAGPISSGDYWYDYRAGFWGITGNHCLGMIPPFIEEFNYPLPKNCAGGNTGVVINGRELHRKDLELLSSRGLPTTPGMSYRVEVTGKVWDEFTGEELYNLGKLAPTVEKMRRGFGMRVPRGAS